MAEPWHGTAGGYTNHKCRKTCCRAAHAAALRKRRHKRYAERDILDGRWFHWRAPHGTTNGYMNYGCRCWSCSDATRRQKGRAAGKENARDVRAVGVTDHPRRTP